MPDLLFLAHRAPFPPDRGDRIRSYHLLRHFARRWRVHLVAFIEHEDEDAIRAGLEPFTTSAILIRRTKSRLRAAIEALATGRPVSLAAFDHPAARAAVAAVAAKHGIDAAFIFSSQMAQYASALQCPVVMDFVDVDSAKFEAYADAASGPMRWMMRREARLLLAHDAAVARAAAINLFVTEAEAALFRSLAPDSRVLGVENGIDTVRYDPATVVPVDSPAPLIVFTGQMDYPPNIEAVRDFARDIFPAIRACHADATFAIVGRAPPAEVRKLADIKGVKVTGEVDDVRPWIAAADVVVAPLRIARGIQNKVLEAMAMARPVVASPHAAEGIDHADTIRVAAAAAAQIDAVLDVLADPVAAAGLGRAARAQVVARYGWDACLTPLDALMGQAA